MKRVLPEHSLASPWNTIKRFLSTAQTSAPLRDRWLYVRGTHGSGKTTLARKLVTRATDSKDWRVIQIRCVDDVIVALSSLHTPFLRCNNTLVVFDVGAIEKRTVPRAIIHSLRQLKESMKTSTRISMILFELSGTETYYPALVQLRNALITQRTIPKANTLTLRTVKSDGDIRATAVPLFRRLLKEPLRAAHSLDAISECQAHFTHVLHLNYPFRVDTLENMATAADALSEADGFYNNPSPCAEAMSVLRRDRRYWPNLILKAPPISLTRTSALGLSYRRSTGFH